jgi:hypothetical protein
VSIQTFRKQDGTEGIKLAARVGDLELIAGQGEAQQQTPAPTRAPAPAPSGFDDMDSDIPF